MKQKSAIARLRGKIERLRYNFRHASYVFRARHPYLLSYVRSGVMLLLPLISIVAVTACLVWLDGKSSASNPLLRFDAQQLVFSQVTIVSLTSSIVALTSGFSARPLYGLRISEVVFDRPVLNLLTLFLPVLLTLVNLGMYFTLQSDIVILVLYCCTFLLTIWQIVRVAEPVIAPKWLDERARRMYYRGCVKQMRNDRPLFPSVDRRMKELWHSTLALIDRSDARVAENIGLEMDLAAQLLCTKRHIY